MRMLNSIAGLRSWRLTSLHTSQRSMCLLTRLRNRALGLARRPSIMAASSAQDSRLDVATSKTPSDFSNRELARDARAWA